LLAFIAVIFALPIITTFFTAIRSNKDILTEGLWALPKSFYLEGFYTVWTKGQMGLYIKNSLIITIPSVLGAIVCASFAAHAVTRFRFRAQNVILIMFFAGMWFPPQTFLVPVYFLTQRIGIYNTYLGVIVVHISYSLPFGVLVLSRFFKAIPNSIIEASRIDGASEIRILTNIVWPLAIPALGSVAIFQFTWIWNDFFWGLVMTQSPRVQPVMVGMTSTLGRFVFDWNGQSASSILALLPPLILFVLLQKYFLEGVRMGAGK
jgi:multiple sugar transport system permease protein